MINTWIKTWYKTIIIIEIDNHNSFFRSKLQKSQILSNFSSNFFKLFSHFPSNSSSIVLVLVLILLYRYSWGTVSPNRGQSIEELDLLKSHSSMAVWAFVELVYNWAELLVPIIFYIIKHHLFWQLRPRIHQIKTCITSKVRIRFQPLLELWYGYCRS